MLSKPHIKHSFVIGLLSITSLSLIVELRVIVAEGREDGDVCQVVLEKPLNILVDTH